MEHEGEVWDVAVVGAGLSGGIVAAQLGAAGVSVIVLESGPQPPAGRSSPLRRLFGPPEARMRLASGRWPKPLLVAEPGGGRRRARAPVLGHGAGGSAALYGAALSRLRRSDLERDYRGGDGDGVLDNSWPIDFETLAADYDRAEALLGLRGGRDPGDPAAPAPLPAAPQVCPRDANLVEDLAANGRRPFRLPVGIAYLPGCSECQGVRCPRGCKAESLSRALDPALAAGRVRLETGTTVRRIDRVGDHLALMIGGPAGQRTIRARRVVLAAGALNTPRILMRSPGLWDGAAPAMLGRGLMFHISDLFAVTDRRGGAVHGPRKTICLRDFYDADGVPLGEIQSLGLEVSAGLVRRYLEDEATALGAGRLGPLLPPALAPIAALAARRFAGAAVFATVTEDLPRPENRVLPGAADAAGPDPIGIEYAVSAELRARCQQLRARARDAFAPNHVRFLSRPTTPNWGHPMGTCRMGTDPAVSVTGADGAVHGAPGVFVADASVMPSSAGTNPSLTVAALALQLADRLAAASGGLPLLLSLPAAEAVSLLASSSR